MPRARPGCEISLLPYHHDRERTRNRRRAPAASARLRVRWSRPALLAHGQNVARLGVQRDCARPVHSLEILLDRELRRAFLLHHCQRPVSVSAECFHGRRVKHRAIRPAGQRQVRKNLAIGSCPSRKPHPALKYLKLERSSTILLHRPTHPFFDGLLHTYGPDLSSLFAHPEPDRASNNARCRESRPASATGRPQPENSPAETASAG